MPKDTFLNLQLEKRRKIMDAAVLEFSERRYSEASINQIIKISGISRGSFYQYFENKSDLYIYLLSIIANEKMQLTKDISISPELDLFDTIVEITKVVFLWVKEKPLYYKIGALMDFDDHEVIQSVRDQNPSIDNLFVLLIEKDIKRGLIKPDINAAIVIEMLSSCVNSYTTEYYIHRSEEKTLEKLKAIMEIIKGGIKC